MEQVKVEGSNWIKKSNWIKCTEMKLKKKTSKSIKSQINNNQKEGQNW